MKSKIITDKLGNECELYILSILDVVQMNITPFEGWKKYLHKMIRKKKLWVRTNLQHYSEQLVNGHMREFLGVLMDEIIDNNSIFVEPNNSFAIAIAQRKSDSKVYRYDIATGTGKVVCYFIMNPKFFYHTKKNYFIKLSKAQQKRIQENIKSGKRYITYEQLITQLDYGYL